MESNYSLADLSAACGSNCCNNGWMNNPFMYLIWLAYMGNGGFGFGNRGEAAATASLSGQIEGLRNQMSDNQNTNTLGAAIGSNHDFLHGLAGQMNMGFAGTNATINAASTGNLLGQKDAQAQMASCCCDIKSSILNQTNALQSQIAGLQSGMMNGFAQVGFLTQQQTNELNTNANANTQRILDKMCADTTQSLRDKLAEASQNAQTSYLISQLKTTA